MGLFAASQLIMLAHPKLSAKMAKGGVFINFSNDLQ